MLVLTRRIGEKIVIDGVISVTVVAIRGDKARLGINAPPSVRVDRSEVHERRLASRPAVQQLSVSSDLEGATLVRAVQQGDRVQVHYVKRSRDGRTASSREPLQLTVGIEHPRLPGLGTALIGLTTGLSMTLTVPPEQAYGLPDPTRIHRWSRERFPKETTLRPGKRIRFTDGRGRRHLIRILEVNSKMVVVDTNHRWAGQTLQLDVKVVAIVAPSPAEGDADKSAPQGVDRGL
ncbi:MAG TPA: carbon storage regulator [Gemmataceae bacterium]|jgi:peptidylprolyl isomerase